MQQLKLDSTIEQKDLSSLIEFVTQLRRGNVELSEIPEWWEWFYENYETLKAELMGRAWTVKKICKTFHLFPRSGEKKVYFVKTALGNLAIKFIPSDGSNQFITFSGVGPRHEIVAEQRQAYRWTQDHLTGLAAAYEQRKADHIAELKAYTARLNDPQTIDDYLELRRVKGLSADQQETLERLVAERTRSQRISERASRLEIGTDALEGKQWTIDKEWHTKELRDIWVARLDDRVEPDAFKQLKARAKAHDGYYSRWSKGFVFYDEAKAKEFIEIDQGNGEETAEQFAEKRQLNAIHHLQALAESIRSGAQDWIDQDHLVNTARRARIYESCLSDRHYQIQIADTLEAICDRLAQGGLQWLDRVRFGSEVHQLFALFRDARWRRAQAESRSHADAVAQPFCEADVEYVQFPYPSISRDWLNNLYNNLTRQAGFHRAYERLHKQYNYTKSPYLIFQNKGKDWDALEKFAACPEWKRRNHSARWAWESIHDAMLPIKRLERMEIGTVYELKQACREFLEVLAAKPELDPATRLELSLVGANRKWTDFYPTKEHIAQEYLEGLSFEGKRVLEPQAGTGRLAEVIQDGDPAYLMCVEVADTQAEILRLKGFEVMKANFLYLTPDDLGTYDLIVSNPPFGKNNNQAQVHAEKSVQFLVPGGQLAIFSLKGVSLLTMDMELCTHEEVEHGWAEGTSVSGIFQVFQKSVNA